jgi:hypothetical protein
MAITPKSSKAELCFFCTALLLYEIYIPTKWLVNFPFCFRSYVPDKVQSEKLTKGNHFKKGKAEVWIFCTAVLLKEFYPPTEFRVNTPCRVRVMSRSKFKV